MHAEKFELIKELMDELQEEMAYSGDELGSRLGREPKVEVAMEVEEEPMEGDEFATDGDFEGPEEKLKQRIMKLRG